jgi:hypothetical protein
MALAGTLAFRFVLVPLALDDFSRTLCNFSLSSDARTQRGTSASAVQRSQLELMSGCVKTKVLLFANAMRILGFVAMALAGTLAFRTLRPRNPRPRCLPCASGCPISESCRRRARTEPLVTTGYGVLGRALKALPLRPVHQARGACEGALVSFRHVAPSVNLAVAEHVLNLLSQQVGRRQGRVARVRIETRFVRRRTACWVER